MEQFDVDPHALAEEVSVLLRQEEKKPEATRMSFKQLTAFVYRGHNIRGEMWHKYNKAIGAILGRRPKKRAAKETSATKKKKTYRSETVLFREVKCKVRSVFDSGKCLHVLITPPDAELLYMEVGGKVKRYGARNTSNGAKKVDRDILALGMKIAKLRFAEKDSPQTGLDLRIQ